MQMTSKEKNLIFFLVVLIIVILTINLVITPGITKQEELKEQLRVAEETKFQTDQLLARADTIDAEVEQLLESTQEMIPPFFNVVDKEYIHMWLDTLAHKHQVILENVTIGDPEVTTVIPYTQSTTALSYPIGEYFNNIVNSTTLETGQVEEAIPLEEGMDQVIRTELMLNMKGTRSKVVNFISEIAHLNKYGIVNNVGFETYNIDDEKTGSITISLYSIHKESDGIFDYPFQ